MPVDTVIVTVAPCSTELPAAGSWAITVALGLLGLPLLHSHPEPLAAQARPRPTSRDRPTTSGTVTCSGP